MSGLTNEAARILAPISGGSDVPDVAVVTASTTATSAADFLVKFGIVSSAGDPPPVDPKFKITVTALGGNAFINFGETSSLAAPLEAATDGSNPTQKACVVPDGASRVFDIDRKRRFYRIVASTADVRVEIVKG